MRYHPFISLVEDFDWLEFTDDPVGFICPECEALNTREDYDNCDELIPRCLYCGEHLDKEN